MGLSSFVRRILGPGFPRLEGQELPDPVDLGLPKLVVDPAQRIAAQGRVNKPKPVKPNLP
jgi:hypothetical protein